MLLTSSSSNLDVSFSKVVPDALCCTLAKNLRIRSVSSCGRNGRLAGETRKQLSVIALSAPRASTCC